MWCERQHSISSKRYFQLNFDLSQDEEMLKAVAERFVVDCYDGDKRRAALAHAVGFSPANWALLGELGLIGMAFDAASGGMSASPTDIAVVFEALGRGLVVEPLVECVLVAGKIFEHYAHADMRNAWMDDLVSGRRRLALAHREPRSRGNPNWVETQSTQHAGACRLTGHKRMVRAGVGADAWIVSARAADGIGLFLVDASATGVACRSYRVIDGTVAAELTLHDAPATPLSGGLDAMIAAETSANLARCAEAVGIMDMLFAATLDYLRTRKQFGVTLGSFQILQHRMVTQYAAIEQARGLLDLAVMNGGAAIAGARAFISTASIQLGHEMIQMHGGMGVTDDLIIGHGHKRLMMLSRYPDDAAAALDEYAGVGADK